MTTDLLYEIALTLIPHISAAQAKILLQHFDTADIFRAKKSDLAAIEGIGAIGAASIVQFRDFNQAAEEIKFLEKSDIRPLFLTDPDYPQRLLHCYDPPTLLYYRGQADLNAGRVLAIVGKRHPTRYGEDVTRQLVAAFAGTNVLLVGGLDLGSDAICHQAAISHGLPAVAVLVHGLDSIYPLAHHWLAGQLVQQGGLLTECRHRTPPGPHLSGQRNRILAGICDAVLVVESDLNGVGMVIAELAGGYFREVFAVPGPLQEAASAGCHYLIRTQQATLLTDPGQLFTEMHPA